MTLSSSPPLAPVRPPGTRRWSAPVGYALLALVLAAGGYWGVLAPPPGVYFTPDEQFISDSGVLMLYGATPRCLDWPALPMVLFYYVLALGHCGLALLTTWLAGGNVVDSFAAADRVVYTYLTDRSPYLLIGRGAQLLLTGALLARAIWVINRADRRWLSEPARRLLVLALVFNTDVLTGTVVIRPEGLAYPLFALVLVQLLFGEAGRRSYVVEVLVLSALLISQRLIFMAMLPLILGGLSLRTTGAVSVRRLIRYAIGLLGLLLITLPFLWTDTLVVIKAFAGGMLVKASASPQSTFFNLTYLRTCFESPTNWVWLLSGVGGVFFVATYPLRVLAGLLVINLLVFTSLVFHASQIYPTHTLPARVLALFLLAYGVAGLLRRLHSPRIQWAGLLLIGGLLVVSMLQETLRYEAWVHRPTNLARAATWLQTLPAETPVLLPAEFENVLPKSRTALARELHALQDPAMSRRKLDRQLRLLSSPTNRAVPTLLQTILLEDERQGELQRQVLLQHTPANRHLNTFFYAENADLVSYHLPLSVLGPLTTSGATTLPAPGGPATTFRYYVTTFGVAGQRPVQTFGGQEGATYYVYQP